ncbi:Uncharacterised protein [Mycobacteroides abscessus subsp. abscessus]|nr:Uncharacterised protein [Mycobacteroides abscessus subsp. abscessus]
MAEEPESAVMMALGGIRFVSSQKIRMGLTGSAFVMAVRCTVVHQPRVFFSMCSRHERSGLRSRRGMRACSVSLASPTKLSSYG